MRVLIESDWNLKDKCCRHSGSKSRVLIESDWNLKFLIPVASSSSVSINRIRLEFKGRPNLRRVTGRPVLIESDWNLKHFFRQ